MLLLDIQLNFIKSRICFSALTHRNFFFYDFGLLLAIFSNILFATLSVLTKIHQIEVDFFSRIGRQLPRT